MTSRLIALPRGMSPGFYAFMAPGCIRTDSGGLLMSVEDRPSVSAQLDELDGLNDDIRRYEQSIARFDEMDPDEVEPEEYQATLARLVALRAKRDRIATPK